MTSGDAAKRAQLSSVQVEILAAYARGEPKTTIASQLHLSVATIDYHTRRLGVFFHTHSRATMVFVAVVSGILSQQWPPEATGQLFIGDDLDFGP